MGKDLKGKELGKGISQRKDGRYQARFVNRFGKRESVYGDTLKEIKNNFASAKAADIKMNNVVSKNITLDEWYEKWMRVYKNPVIRDSTRRYYKHIYLSKISPILGKKRLNDITKLQVVELFNQLKEQGYAWDTLNKTKLLLVDMLNRANEDDFVSKNVAKGAAIPVRRKKGVCQTLSKDEQDAFLECSTGQFYHNLFLVAINTGLRPGELFALTESDIDFQNKIIRVNKTLSYDKFDGDTKKEFHLGDPKTETSTREVPINEICKNALIKQVIQTRVVRNRHAHCKTKQKKTQTFPDLLFTTKFGTPLNVELFNEAISRVVCEANLTRDELEQIPKISGHSLRHTFATRCFEAGIPPKTVQAYLGHSSIKMTMDLYTSVLDQKKQDDMKLLEESIGIKPQDLSAYSSNIIHFHVS